MNSLAKLEAEYVIGGQGAWLITRWLSQSSSNETALFIVPPFAEEMNCCRRNFARLAFMLADLGIDCFLPDFYGSGDSSGDFQDISLQQWQQDTLNFLPRLAGYRQVHLLGCRFGAALLLDWLSQIEHIVSPGLLLLWQPQLDTGRFWQQLLRLQQFSDADSTSKTTLHVAGYPIPLRLQAESSALKPQLPADLSRLTWFESTLTGQPTAATAKLIQTSPALRIQTVVGQPYWLSQEPVDTDALLEATVATVRSFV